MQYRKLGKTAIEISTIGLGCWGFGGGVDWGNQTENQAIRTIHAALDVGINFFDTAESYGDGISESIVGKGLMGRRSDAVISTKVNANHLEPGQLIKSCEDSLHRLQTDHIDLYQIHWPNHAIPIAKTWHALEQLVASGKVRAIGVSNFGIDDSQDLIKFGNAVSNQLPYSLLWRGIEWEVRGFCAAHNISILCYSPLAQGLLSGKYTNIEQYPEERMMTRLFSRDRPETHHEEEGTEDLTFMTVEMIRGIAKEKDISMPDLALSWLLAQKGVTSVLAGARTEDQVRQNARAAELYLDKSVIDELNDVSALLKEEMGTNLDQYSDDSIIR